MSIEKSILNLIAKREVISIEELHKEIKKIKNIDKNALLAIVNKLKEEGLIYSSDMLFPTTIIITAKGTNSIESL